MAMEKYRTGTGQLLTVHSRGVCNPYGVSEAWCTVHNRKPGHMRDWPTHWRSDAGFMEVLCPHGVGHPAPENKGSGMHGCDGCCVEKETKMSKPLVHTGAPGDDQEYLVRQGGLMRCCLLTLKDWYIDLAEPGDGLTMEGKVLPCRFCNSSMIFTEDAWEWNRAKTNYELRR